MQSRNSVWSSWRSGGAWWVRIASFVLLLNAVVLHVAITVPQVHAAGAQQDLTRPHVALTAPSYYLNGENCPANPNPSIPLAGSAPAEANFGGYLYFATQDCVNGGFLDVWKSKNPAGGASSWIRLNTVTNMYLDGFHHQRVALCPFENQLWVAWISTLKPNELYLGVYQDNATAIASVMDTHQQSYYSPALAGWLGELWVAWNGTNSGHSLNIASWVGNVFTKQTISSISGVGGPGLAGYDGAQGDILYFADFSGDSTGTVTTGGYNGGAYPFSGTVVTATTNAQEHAVAENYVGNVSLAAGNGDLYVAWLDAGYNVDFKKASDGQSWGPQHQACQLCERDADGNLGAGLDLVGYGSNVWVAGWNDLNTYPKTIWFNPD